MKILFVCTGNTCRSSMAEALAKKLLRDKPGGSSDIQFSSAGIAAFPAEPASREAVQVMSEMGTSLEQHRAVRLGREQALKADLILTMTRSHLEHVKQLFPELTERVFTLAEYAGSSGDVPDPIGQPLAGYRSCARRLEKLISGVLDRVAQK